MNGSRAYRFSGGSDMHSYRVLGVVALSAIVVAVISFTVVGISIDSVNGCLAAHDMCARRAVPPAAITFGALGAVALLVAIVPATRWMLGMLHHPAPRETLPRREVRPLLIDEEL
jgi:hypothetical protein